ncbi:MAG TPA: ectonucleotide pyrophosphatase/phosphodiesterase, partial [Ramlibacter sp.]|nr:ectonucleotide pyrophosphatase/phosphodiesterase [Ramlibacter sp.]
NREAVADPRWWGGEPIWVTLQKHGGNAATMFWPGSEAPIAGQHPRYWHRFDAKVTPDQRVDQVLAWLDLPATQRPRFITLYFDQVDHAAHDAGPHAPGTLAAMREVDTALQRLLAGLDARQLRGGTDLIVVSDHGMAEVPRGNEVHLDARVPATAIDVLTYGQVVGLFPAAGREHEVASALLGRHEHYGCWRKAELPPHWHYGTHARIPPVVCQADPGWELTTRARSRPEPPVRGEHGFAPETVDMRAVFIAAGPDFASGRRIAAFDNVHVYPLLAGLLDLPAQDGDGDLAALRPALSRAGRARVSTPP